MTILDTSKLDATQKLCIDDILDGRNFDVEKTYVVPGLHLKFIVDMLSNGNGWRDLASKAIERNLQ